LEAVKALALEAVKALALEAVKVGSFGAGCPKSRGFTRQGSSVCHEGTGGMGGAGGILRLGSDAFDVRSRGFATAPRGAEDGRGCAFEEVAGGCWSGSAAQSRGSPGGCRTEAAFALVAGGCGSAMLLFATGFTGSTDGCRGVRALVDGCGSGMLTFTAASTGAAGGCERGAATDVRFGGTCILKADFGTAFGEDLLLCCSRDAAASSEILSD